MTRPGFDMVSNFRTIELCIDELVSLLQNKVSYFRIWRNHSSSNLNLALKGEWFLQIAVKVRKQEYLERLVEFPVSLLLQNVGFKVECGGGGW